MTNEYISKVVLATGEVPLDLTKDDVKPEHVDKGITFHDKSGAPQTGTSTKTVDASEVTTEAAEVLNGRPFGKGDKIEYGTMPDNSGNNVVISSTEPVTIPRGFTDGSSKVTISPEELAKLKPENIKEGVTILNVPGGYGTDDFSSQSKEVTPTFEDQNVVPDEGITFLSSVTVKKIPITYTDNDAGGVTMTIG